MPGGVYWTIAKDAKLTLAVFLTTYAELAVSFYMLEFTWLYISKKSFTDTNPMACCEG